MTKKSHAQCCKEYREKHSEHVKNYEKQYRAEHRGQRRAAEQRNNAARVISKRKQRAKYADRYRARTKVMNALSDGLIKRQLCLVCGETAEAHHPDYSRPLDVVWLCRKHHKETHDLVKEAR